MADSRDCPGYDDRSLVSPPNVLYAYTVWYHEVNALAALHA